jgi:hypothetical protein
MGEVIRAIGEHTWLAPPIAITWILLKTHTARVADLITSTEVLDRWLRAKGIPEDKRRELIIEAAKRDLGS